MSSLYQRARPVTFDQVVGQEHVKEVLSAAVQRGRTGHAYLFSGPRGVGKTTTARLLAMAVNCEIEALDQRPCGVCESCRLVQSGSHPDVAELDAASNNSVDDVRDLRERVGLASLRGGVRVWILDEAHMLSKAAANALLKTLEEPPPGLIFILATTEPEKLPATILSRCQHFRFRRLSDDEIAGKLARLCQEADVVAEPEALALVARAADGGMRDAESLLDRLLVSGATITAENAEEALGLPPRDRLTKLSEALLTFELEGLLAEAAELYRAGFAPRTVAEQLGRFLRDSLHEALGSGAKRAAGETTSISDKLVRLIQALDDEHDRFVRRNDLYSLEVALIKAASALRSAGARTGVAEPTADNLDDRTAVGSQAAAPTKPAEPAGKPVAARESKPESKAKAEPATEPATKPASKPAETAPEKAAEKSGSTNQAAAKPFSWHAVKSAAGPQLKAFLQPATGAGEGLSLSLTYDERYKFHYDQLLQRRGELEALIESVAGPGHTLVIHGPGGRRAGGGPKKA